MQRVSTDDSNSSTASPSNPDTAIPPSRAAGRVELASEQGKTELELVESQLGSGVVALSGEWKEILDALEGKGTVTTRVCNMVAEHWTTGTVADVRLDNPHVGMIYHDNIDWRFFLHAWSRAFAILDPEALAMPTPALSFFSHNGQTIVDVEMEWSALADIAEAFSVTDYEPAEIREGGRPTPDGTPDYEALREGWRNLQDTHDFFPLLHRLGIGRLDALENAPEGFVKEIDLKRLQTAFERGLAREIPIMSFVSTPGLVHIHSDVWNSYQSDGSTLMIAADRFGLRVDAGAIERVFVVKKPTKRGPVHSLEIFGPGDSLDLQFFGQRDDDAQENEHWRALVTGL